MIAFSRSASMLNSTLFGSGSSDGQEQGMP